MQALPLYRLLGGPRHQRSRGKVSPIYSQRYRLVDDPPRKVRVISLKTTDKTAARRIATACVEKAIRKTVEEAEPSHRHVDKTIAQHLHDYISDLRAEGRSPKYVDLCEARINAMIAGCKFKTIKAIEPRAIKGWLAGKRENVMSVGTSTLYAANIKGFSRWLARHDRLPKDPLALMAAKPKGDVPVTFRRRSLTDAEFDKLIKSVKPQKVRGLSADQRKMLYRVGRVTGYRAHELSTIRPMDCKLEGDAVSIEIACTISKRRKADRQLLPSATVKQLVKFIKGKPRDRDLWPGRWFRKARRMLAIDLEGSGVKTETEEGRIDFHSLRHTFVTNVVSSGAPLPLVMQLARLSSPELVKRSYHAEESQARAIIEKLSA